MSNNPYEILHLEEDATYDEIKERYRHLTRSLHPDKQPLENYQMTKKLFEQIDEAYKAISSPLRRHLFREYGMAALKVLEDVPGYFEEFDQEELTPEQINRLKQLMVYLLYEREASIQTDKTKFVTKMVVNISKTFKGRPRNAKRHSKRNYYIPEIENCSFDYEMVLPEFLGFANTFAVSQTTSNIKTDPKATMSFAVSMARRIYWNYMLLIQGSFSSEESNIALGVTRVCENNLSLTFTPLSFTNWSLNAPKLSIEKSLQDYQISGTVQATGGISIDYSESTQKKVGKSLKLFMEQGSIGMIPRIQVQVSDTFRLFAQISAAVELQGKQGINLRPSFTYGYRLALSEDMKIELASCIASSSNYLQLSFLSSKFRVGIPLLAAEINLGQFQLFKVVSMVLTLAAVEGLKAKRRSDARNKHRLFKENQTRLNELKRQINRRLSDVELSAQLKRELETKYNGLIIIRAYFGAEDKIEAIAKKLKKMKLDKELKLERSLSDIEEAIIGLHLPVESIQDEAQDITSLLQSEVLGGQLLNYSLEQLKKYSPVIEPSTTPSIFILYVERGELKTHSGKCEITISLGTKPISHSTKIRQFLHNLIDDLI